MIYRKCCKCGQVKLAILERRDLRQPVAMKLITYGKHNGEFKCKDCKEVIK